MDDRDLLRRLRDEHAIRRVIMTYPRGQDRGDGAAVASIYFDDAWDFHGGAGWVRGVDYGTISDHDQRTRPGEFGMHFMGETFYEFDGTGDVAHTETYVRASRADVRDGEHRLQLFFGRYLDRFERRDGRWAIAQRVTVRDYTCVLGVEPMMAARPFQGVRRRDDVSFAHLRFEDIAASQWSTGPHT